MMGGYFDEFSQSYGLGEILKDIWDQSVANLKCRMGKNQNMKPGDEWTKARMRSLDLFCGSNREKLRTKVETAPFSGKTYTVQQRSNAAGRHPWLDGTNISMFTVPQVSERFVDSLLLERPGANGQNILVAYSENGRYFYGVVTEIDPNVGIVNVRSLKEDETVERPDIQRPDIARLCKEGSRKICRVIPVVGFESMNRIAR